MNLDNPYQAPQSESSEFSRLCPWARNTWLGNGDLYRQYGLPRYIAALLDNMVALVLSFVVANP